MTRLRLVASPAFEDEATAQRLAYAHVADGYRKAATVAGLSLEDAGRIRRCLRHAERLADLSLLSEASR
jgi:uncharacterized protein YerC